jgi:P-type Ca2+ transporter type 2C
MHMSAAPRYGIKGLTSQVTEASKLHGRNEVIKDENHFLSKVRDILKDSMLMLLLVAASLYFISGEIGNSSFMTFVIFLITGISLYQESRSRNALATLFKNLKDATSTKRSNHTH